MSRATIEDLDLAAEWCEANEGDERDRLLLVAEFLREEIARRKAAALDRQVRALAKKTGRPVAEIRARIEAKLRG